MSFLEKIATKAFRLAGATEIRQYAASKNNRLVGDWTTQNASANTEIRQSIKVLRARARQLARDDDYFIGFLKDLESNVVGSKGIQLQVNAQNADGAKQRNLNTTVEEAFRLWSRKQNCTVTGQDSLRDVLALSLKTLATDGEFLIRLVFDNSSEFGLKLQFLDVDWLDEDFNDPKCAATGNRIIMSIEVDAFDKPVAYWFTQPKWGNVNLGETPVVPGYKDRLRVPAEQIIHRFVKDRVGQLRGVTWAHGAMLRLNMLGGYEEAELVGARVAASQMAFVSPGSDETELANVNGTQTQIETEISPGMIMELPAGYQVHEFSPNRPGSSYQIYTKTILRAIAKSLGVSYNSLTSDLESTSYSSMRAGTIAERDIWKLIQTWLIDHLLQDVYECWLMFNMRLVPATKINSVKYPTWRARGFDWVDPSKDTRADIEAADRGIKTLTEILGERGKDFEEEIEQHAYERDFIESKGLVFNSPNYPTSPDEAAALSEAMAKANPQQSEKEGGNKMKPKAKKSESQKA